MSQKESDGYYHLRFFASVEDYQLWQEDRGAHEALLLQDVAIPILSDTEAATFVELSTLSNRESIISLDNKVVLEMRYTSVVFNPMTQTSKDTDEACTVRVDIMRNGVWATVGERAMASVPYDSSMTTQLDISDLVPSGTSQVRVSATGNDTGLTTSYVYFAEIIKTEVGLTFANPWHQPITGDSMTLQYRIVGAVNKVLRISIDGTPVVADDTIGSNQYTETPYSVQISKAEVMTSGVHNVEAWLEVPRKGDLPALLSDKVVSQVLVIGDDYDGLPRIILNNVATEATNWTDLTYFDYAVYSADGTDIALDFVLESDNGKKEYSRYHIDAVKPGEQYSYSTTMEVDEDATSFAARMRIYSDGVELTSYVIEVDNTQNFAPTKGADFVFNPKLHTNSGSQTKVYNDATGEVVEATFSNFGFVNDGYVADADGVQCMRVRAGKNLSINYEAYDKIANDVTESLTIEVDFATRNVINQDEPAIRMCSYGSDGLPVGLEMLPMEACFMLTGLRTRLDQDVMWQEDQRTRLSVNIIYNLAGKGINYIRIFVNGIINREISYTRDNRFPADSEGIRIGASQADVDVYGIRIYKKALSSSDIMQDYVSSLPTVEEKMAFRRHNAILGTVNGKEEILYESVFGKYNTLLWKYNESTPDTRLATYGDKGVSLGGDLVINKVGDRKHSGTYSNMTTKGQGTSSMSYWKWNQRFQPEEGGVFTNLDGEVTEGYQLEDGMPFATRLDGKINWASPMQSHKMGATALYQDVWTELVKDGVLNGNALTQRTDGQSFTGTAGGYKDCRVCVKQDWFMMFVQENADTEPHFYGLFTWGPGKGDKPTFGYDKKTFPNYTMLEGCDNALPLVMHRVPWDNDVKEEYDDEGSLEAWSYNGQDSWEISIGSGKLWPEFKETFNWLYHHHTDILPFTGTFEELQASSASEWPRSHDYWVTRGSATAAQYDLFRYDGMTMQWVPAGLNKQPLNIATQLGITPTTSSWSTLNDRFKAERRSIFRAALDNGQHFDKYDLMFTMQFLKLKGATDNWGKNTYLYKMLAGDPIRFMQDDLDTIKLINNVGRKTKPYYMEEHDVDSDGIPFTPSVRNVLYNLMEECYPDELRAMMRNILSVLERLGGNDPTKRFTPLEMAMKKYFWDVQTGIPAVAYNEIARLLYEDAAYNLSIGNYQNNTPPLQQCLGDQLQAEMQWDRLRLIYLCSYASYGIFSASGEVSGAFSFRSLGTDLITYQFKVTPHIWLYPAFGGGDSNFSVGTRVPAGEVYDMKAYGKSVQVGNDTNVRILGIDYLRDIGNMAEHAAGKTLSAISGKRLTAFRANGGGTTAFAVTDINTVSAPNLEVIDLTGTSTLGGSLNLSVPTRLKELRLGGTKIQTVTMPKGETLTTVVMPPTLTELTIDGQTRLEYITLSSIANIERLTIVDAPAFDSYRLINERFAGTDNKVAYIDMEVNWSSCSTAVLNYLLSVPTCKLRGTIKMGSGQNINFTMKQKLVAKFGEVDKKSNPLYIEYSVVALTSCAVMGSEGLELILNDDFEPTPDANGNPYHETYQFTLANAMPSANANDITRVEWSIEDDGTFAKIDKTTGLLTIVQFPEDGAKPTTGVNATVYTLAHPEGFSAERMVFRLYYRQAEVGDYVYHDGTFSEKRRYDKTVIGRCFYVNVLEDGYVDRRMVAVNENGFVSVTGTICPSGQEVTLNPTEQPDMIDGITGGEFNVLDMQWASNNDFLLGQFFRVNNNGLGLSPGWNIPSTDVSVIKDEGGNFKVSDGADFLSNGIANNGTSYLQQTCSTDGTYLISGTGGDRLVSVYDGNPSLRLQYTITNYWQDIEQLTERKVGERIPWSRLQHLMFIYRRNAILNNNKYSDFGGVPTASSTQTEMQNLQDRLSEMSLSDSKMLYPIASLCHAYQPSVDKIASQFKAHQWYWPSTGELIRLAYENVYGKIQMTAFGTMVSCSDANGKSVIYVISTGKNIQGSRAMFNQSTFSSLICCAF